MLIRFIAHAGFALEEDGHQLLIDPWFTDSSMAKPVMQATVGYNTIDFQIPQTREKIADYTPDTIIVSHFHTHHAPHDDMVTLVSQSEKITLGFPKLSEANQAVLSETFSLWPQATLRPFAHNDALQAGPFTIRGMFHTLSDHMAWYVQSATGSVLHIADPRINRDRMNRMIGEEWKPFENLRPDMLCINAGGNIIAQEKNGVRALLENAAVSPTEAARLAEYIKPKAVCLIGCYNWSVWRNRREYIRPAPIVEEELFWALSWLLPDTKYLTLKPGITIGIGDPPLGGNTDYFIRHENSRE